MTYARSVFVIHNIAHQGRGPFFEVDSLELNDHFKEQCRLDDPVGGEHMNVMKAGFITAHRIIAVSRGYAWECQTQVRAEHVCLVLLNTAAGLRSLLLECIARVHCTWGLSALHLGLECIAPGA
jgi:glycogen synthase